MKAIEHFLESFMFNARWLLAPFYLGLVLALALLMVKFIKEFVAFAPLVFTGRPEDVVLGVLALIDIVMIGNLILIIVFAGYENFVSKIGSDNHEDRPDWMGHVGFADLKMKLIGSIVAISGIELLKAFMHTSAYSREELAWKVGLHMTFVISGVLFAVMDRLSAGKNDKGH
ncbi:MAG: TIGR00645 family protein [Casimicrobiaceae bacterium]|nr:TIGR00645 family protein [Casimicrobiaceae bacterium]MCX8098118.1 TIGR00645 family protein [Casimicrobiaceae bacterium]MDW8311656.1 TIGR00645 family protein [Burkholderiales bacterium]